MILKLTNQLKTYDWGDIDSIARFLGQRPDGSPIAELWMGAHPAGSSLVSAGGDAGTSLLDLIASHREETLGRAAAAGATELPFLFKLLAAGKALSIQVHPSREQAKRGYERENAQGIALDAPERTYKDRNHKPELMLAAGPFWAMSGFRDPAESAAVLALTGIRASDTRGILSEVLALTATDLAAAVSRIDLPDEDPEDLYRAQGGVTDAVRFAWVHELQRQYGLDPGILAPLFLNVVRLDAGEALYQGAGLLHAYLRGFGFEVMANCDNVLRAGLTPKFMNVAELLEIVDFGSGPPARVTPVAHASDVLEYPCPVPDFRLLQLDLRAQPTDLSTGGCPAIVLCTRGSIQVGTDALKLSQGESAFVGGGNARIKLASSNETQPAQALVASCAVESA
ncbi:MAG: mannose-6-phosphate isomerase, class I [Spirochaetaceae bacterium]|nr:MAG: mannose-6-phosphate isomerase, class I [Spirochaetaceae bacterium]